ncbi:MAG TPA: maltose alpha-D-glucosyltransferase [Xanthobacteraceae bacterium]|nr:maltose alpha-D-glucosyltransferase [Xanthobacteraceae bacterium]
MNFQSRPTAAELAPDTDELWYKSAIIYQLHVKSFADSNHDGIGDFAGLTEKLDYLQDLGVTALWLLPFYPSPGRDDGYDIADYSRINPEFGSMKDFRRFMQEARRRGLRVITELVINHTSDQHPWFQRARKSAPHTDARNWYVWSDTDTRYAGTRIIFKDTEKSNWAWDPEANAYYWHRFFSHQPDLNYDNPRVFEAIVRVMRKWLDLGVDGFRLDAIPYLVEREGTSNENLPETHEVIRRIRAALDAHSPGKLLLAEANQWPEDVAAYFGNGDECHMAYHFPLMPRIYMAIAQEDRFPITDILRQTPDIPANCQWALFLRNHDELTLEMVTDVERDYLWSTYATDPRARLNLGIRRRLASLMEGDRRKIELMNSLLLSLPGTPIIYYGDEIGMGDNIYLGDRNGVRTPMQWTPDRNGGFSRCDPAKLYAPPVMDPVFGYEAVNVEAQSRNLSSLLSWTKRMIVVRKSSKVFGYGSLAFLRPANRAVFSYVREYEGEVLLCVANLSRSAQAAEIDLSAWKGWTPIEMLGRSEFPPIREEPYLLTLAPYGFLWFRLIEKPEHREILPVVPEFATLVLTPGRPLLQARTRTMFEREVAPVYLARARWFADKGARQIRAHVKANIPVLGDGKRVDVTLVEVTSPHATADYVLPLAVHWSRFDRERDKPNAVGAVRQGPREGTLFDVAAQDEWISLLLAKLCASETVEAEGRSLEFRPSSRLTPEVCSFEGPVRAVNTEQSNSTALVDEKLVVKLFRRLAPGVNPEIEIGRFLTEVVGFANSPALLGDVELVEEGGERSSIAVVHEFIGNQGEAWTVTSAYLERFVEEQRLLASEDAAKSSELAAYQRMMAQIARRLAQMQIALASRDDIEDFRPEPITAQDSAAWIEAIMARANGVRERLDAQRIAMNESDRAMAEHLLDAMGSLETTLHGLIPANLEASKIRTHGDFHLGQVLIAKDDVFIIDFEGEPNRTIAQRRAKGPAARDVAGLVRSIDYSTTAALERALANAPDEQGRLAPALAIWRDVSAATFVAAYREALTDSRLWPQERDEADRLLDLFLIDKALYEIEYELSHRPQWLRVPLAGILRILAARQEKLE